MTDDHALRRATRAQVLAGPVQAALDREPEDALSQFAWAVRCLQEVDGIAAAADRLERGEANALSLITSIARYPAAAAYAIRAAPTETDAEARRHVLRIVRAWDESADHPGLAAVREQIGDELTAGDDSCALLAATAIVEYAELDAMIRAQLGLPDHT